MKDVANLRKILSIVTGASREILSVFNARSEGEQDSSALNLTQKVDGTPVTIADKLAHALIVDGLGSISLLPVLSEEGKSVAFSERSQWSNYWCVDPLDGTKEFIAGIGEFTVNIALIAGGRAILGVIAAPVSREVYVGVSVETDYELGVLRSVLGDALPAKCAPFHFAEKTIMRESNSQQDTCYLNSNILQLSAVASPLRLLTSRYHGHLNTPHSLSLIRPFCAEAMGSSLKMCKIAEGKADAYVRFGPTSEWDTAAAQAILEGAGGRLLDMQGKPLRYNQNETLLNPPFFAGGQELSVNSDGLICYKKPRD